MVICNIDPITVALLERQFLSITEEMSKTLMRTSRSPIFAESRDFATGLFDKNLRLIAETDYLPLMASALPMVVENMVKSFKKEEIFPGDVLIQNDNYAGNTHSPDVNIAKPVFYRGKVIFWTAVKGHMADIGGRGIAGFDPSATTIWEDGLIIPCCKLYSRGIPNHDLWEIILKNIKTPEIFEGDIHCEVGAVAIGERQCLALLKKYPQPIIYKAIDNIISVTENAAHEKIRQIKDGIYYGEKSLDHDAIDREKPVTVRAKVVKRNSEICIDLSESDTQTPGFVNSSETTTYSACRMAIFYSILGEIPRNQGSLDPIKIITRKGSWVDPNFPASVTMSTTAIFCTIAEAIWLALAPAIPSLIAAPHGKACSCNIIGFNPRVRRSFSIIDFFTAGVGSGGTKDFDGWEEAGPSQCMGQLRIPDPEIMELVAPVHILQFEHIGGREGAGEFRGGHGAKYKVQYLTNAKMVQLGAGMRDFSAASGVLGGKNAQKTEVYFHRANGTSEKLDLYKYYDIKSGDIYEQQIMGGGGYGYPYKRLPQKVRQDVIDEWLSIEEAKTVYGVIIKPDTLEINEESTWKLRKSKKAEK